MKTIIKRNILKALQKHSKKKEITLIIGPRQVGKTTIMKSLDLWLTQQGQKTIWFNLDFQSDLRYFQSQQQLINKLNLEFGNSTAFVFIDEIQRKEEAGMFLKGIYDQNLPYKFIISGSGSVELKEKVHESLMGRKLLFEMNTVSFLEFFHFRTDYKYKTQIEQFFQIEKELTQNLLQEYLEFGG